MRCFSHQQRSCSFSQNKAEMKFPLQPLKVSQVLTSSLLTSLRHKYWSLLHLFGRHRSSYRMHLVICVAITSTADAVNQGWWFRPLWCPSAPVTAHANCSRFSGGKWHILRKWKSSVVFGPEQHGTITQKASVANMSISAFLWLCDCVCASPADGVNTSDGCQQTLNKHIFSDSWKSFYS